MLEVCFLLRLFHETVSPFAKERCIMSAKTGTHLRSVTETLWFVEDIATYAYEMLQSHQGDTVQRFDFIPLPHARQIVRTLLDDACTGKWSWTPRPDVELLLTQAEREECEKNILERFISGCDADSPPPAAAPESSSSSWMPLGLNTQVLVRF